LVPLELNVLLLKLCQAQFLVTQLYQKTLIGLIFALAVAAGVRGQLETGPKAFVIDRTPDPPLCENIKHTLGKSIIV
jgi:hypothetical protein